MMVCDGVMYLCDPKQRVVVLGIPCESIIVYDDGSAYLLLDMELYPLSFLDNFREQAPCREWYDWAYVNRKSFSNT